ncbi:MAG: transposase [Planctomycetota bacterium]
MTQKRRSYTPQQKAEYARMFLKDRVPVSEIADKFDIHPTLINGWIRSVLE